MKDSIVIKYIIIKFVPSHYYKLVFFCKYMNIWVILISKNYFNIGHCFQRAYLVAQQ